MKVDTHLAVLDRFLRGDPFSSYFLISGEHSEEVRLLGELLEEEVLLVEDGGEVFTTAGMFLPVSASSTTFLSSFTGCGSK